MRSSEGPHATFILVLCPWCRKHSAYCPTDFLKWSWRGPLIVEEIRRSDVRSQRRMVAVLVAPTSPCTRSVNYAYAVDALADPCPHVQADVFCLQETQDKTFCSTFVPAFRSQYVPFQSAPTYGAYMRYRYDLTKSTFVRCAPGWLQLGQTADIPWTPHAVDVIGVWLNMSGCVRVCAGATAASGPPCSTLWSSTTCFSIVSQSTCSRVSASRRRPSCTVTCLHAPMAAPFPFSGAHEPGQRHSLRLGAGPTLVYVVACNTWAGIRRRPNCCASRTRTCVGTRGCQTSRLFRCALVCMLSTVGGWSWYLPRKVLDVCCRCCCCFTPSTTRSILLTTRRRQCRRRRQQLLQPRRLTVTPHLTLLLCLRRRRQCLQRRRHRRHLP